MLDIALMREFFYVTVGTILIITFAILFFVQKIKREGNRLTSYMLHASAIIDEAIPTTLNGMCEECFDDYRVLNAEIFDIAYINDELERRIQKEVLLMLFERISPAFLDKLSLYYNPNNLSEIITRKMVILVTAYVVEINKMKDTKEEVPSNKK